MYTSRNILWAGAALLAAMLAAWRVPAVSAQEATPAGLCEIAVSETLANDWMAKVIGQAHFQDDLYDDYGGTWKGEGTDSLRGTGAVTVNITYDGSRLRIFTCWAFASGRSEVAASREVMASPAVVSPAPVVARTSVAAPLPAGPRWRDFMEQGMTENREGYRTGYAWKEAGTLPAASLAGERRFPGQPERSCRFTLVSTKSGSRVKRSALTRLGSLTFQFEKGCGRIGLSVMIVGVFYALYPVAYVVPATDAIDDAWFWISRMRIRGLYLGIPGPWYSTAMRTGFLPR